MFITNALSLNMIQIGSNIQTAPITAEHVSFLAQQGHLTSAIGHEDTAQVVSSVLGSTIGMNRVSIALNEGDLIVVAQYKGPRLAEGSTTLPADASIEFALILVGDQWNHYEFSGDAPYSVLSSKLGNAQFQTMLRIK